jgi:Zn finger protein HypA/HybF involved in hydrogenase expression
MTEKNANDENPRYKCDNCDAVFHHEVHEYEQNCPECRVGSRHEMVLAECPDCDSEDFDIYQPAPGASINAADAYAECRNCGRKGRFDDQGLWW